MVSFERKLTLDLLTRFDLFEIDLIQLNMLEIVLVRSDTFKNRLFGMFD